MRGAAVSTSGRRSAGSRWSSTGLSETLAAWRSRTVSRVPVSLTLDQAAAELRARGHTPENIVALSGGLWSAAFAYRDRGGEYVVRFHERRDDLEKDRFAERWQRGVLRIPHMVEIGES